MNEENVNPDNVNPHMADPAKFGLTPPETNLHDFAYRFERPCPSCGHCPTCGRSNAPVYYGPWWGITAPVLCGDQTSGNGTVTFGAIS